MSVIVNPKNNLRLLNKLEMVKKVNKKMASMHQPFKIKKR